MATVQPSVNAAPARRTTVREYPAVSWRFDMTVSLLTLWFIIGLFVDGYAHNHGAVDNTFFTPWHALLYSGILATGAFLAYHQYRNVGRGHAWSRALPKGYLLSLLGVVFFFMGGAFDFVWHEMFGFEANMEALLSPAHLILASTGVLIIGGPIRAAWGRSQADTKTGWRAMLPTLLSLLMLFSMFTFFTQYSNMFSQGRILTADPSGSRYFWDTTGISYVIVQALLTMFIVLLAVRRWQLPFGALTALFTLNATLMLVLRWEDTQDFLPTLLAAPAAGLVGDWMLQRYAPITQRTTALRVFSFIVPLVMFGVNLAILMMGYGIFWREHMWLGATLTGAFVGLGLSYLLVPPAIPDDTQA